MGLLRDVRRMREQHHSSWFVAWTRVRAVRHHKLMTPEQREIEYRALREQRSVDGGSG